jgi:hypothetical protein
MKISQSFGIEAQIIGRVEASDKQKLTISKGEAEIQYQL